MGYFGGHNQKAEQSFNARNFESCVAGRGAGIAQTDSLTNINARKHTHTLRLSCRVVMIWSLGIAANVISFIFIINITIQLVFI